MNYGEELKYRIEFKDSYLILLNSLNRLSKAFSVSNPKSLFPHLFVNKNNLNYIGEVPNFEYFIKVSKNEYQDYKKGFNSLWILKVEALEYCKLDCISLYQVLIKFNSMIFDLFGKNIHHYPTLPSLAFAIFRSNFMTENTVPQLSGQIAEDIRQSYTGGSVDMYIPENKSNKTIYCYDVNSLYPSVMRNNSMPIGNASYFVGDIRAIDPESFGFFYCEITAPNNLKHPILQTHVKTVNGLRTMAPLGQWNDMLFSVEMDNAISLGYKIEILWGYTFEKANIFKDYVDFLYNFRLNYPKSDPMNYIAKILLNSLYGRFGMDDNFTEVSVIHMDFYNDFENKYLDNIKSSIKLGEYYLIEFAYDKNQIENEQTTHNISIGVASAITAYARIEMSQFKNNSDINLYYTDTDSVYVDKPLPDHLIDSKILGKLKLENICTKAIFLSPKVYCLLTDSGKFIYKVKGLKHDVPITLNEFKLLLGKDAFVTKHQTKWFRSLSDANINLLENIYTLKITDNKRLLIYNKDNRLTGTKPYVIDNRKVINN
jgi:DNA polymerase type B, organellar and viral